MRVELENYYNVLNIVLVAVCLYCFIITTYLKHVFCLHIHLIFIYDLKADCAMNCVCAGNLWEEESQLFVPVDGMRLVKREAIQLAKGKSFLTLPSTEDKCKIKKLCKF